MAQQMSELALGPKGPGVQGPNAAMQAIQNMMSQQQAQAKKAMDSIVAMQQEAEMRSQQEAAATQSAVMDVANQVSGGMGKMQEKRDNRKEKIENLKIQEDMTRFNQELQANAQGEMDRLSAMKKGAQDASLTAVQVWREKKEESTANINGVWAKLQADLAAGKYEGRQEEADKVFQELRHGADLHEDAFDPAYISSVARRLNDTERDIAAGRDPMDLAAMYESPTTQEYADINGRGDLPAIPGRERYQMFLRGGAPENGVFTLPLDSPVRERMRMVDPATTAKFIAWNNDYTQLISEESRKKHLKTVTRYTNDMVEQFGPTAKVLGDLSEQAFARMPEATRMGFDAYLRDTRPEKFQRPGETLGMSIVHAMYPEQGPAMAKLALGIRNGTEELDTTPELLAASMMEMTGAAGEAHVQTLISEINGGSLGKDKEGHVTSNVAILAQQWATTQPPGSIAKTYGADTIEKDGVTLTGTGLAKVQFQMVRDLNKTAEWFGELKRSARDQGVLKSFVDEFGSSSRTADALVYTWLTTKSEDKQKALDMLYGGTTKAANEKWEGMTTEERGAWGNRKSNDPLTLGDTQHIRVKPSETQMRNKTILENYIEFIKTVSPKEVPYLMGILAGGKHGADMTDGNHEIFNKATRKMTESGQSEYMVLFDARRKAAKMVNDEAKKRESQGTPMSSQEGIQIREQSKRAREQMVQQVQQARTAEQRKGAVETYLSFMSEILAYGVVSSAQNIAGNISDAAGAIKGAVQGVVNPIGSGIGAGIQGAKQGMQGAQ